MSHNPYTTPTATVAQSLPDVITLYSPNQAAVGAFIGGPVGLVYFVRQNFVSLGNDSAAKKSLIFGLLFVLALIIILPLLPANIPSAPLNVVYIFAARRFVEKFQLSKSAIIESSEYRFKSNWTVFGMGVLTLLISVALLVGPYMAFIALGLAK